MGHFRKTMSYSQHHHADIKQNALSSPYDAQIYAVFERKIARNEEI